MHDVESRDGETWLYSPVVKDHFFNPRNILKTAEEAEAYSRKASGIGMVGSPACGDVMKMWIVVKDGRVAECKWQTFGCASAIASTSMFSEMLTANGGLTIGEALKITARDIAGRLGGLPIRKFHCSVLADKAFKAAVEDWRARTGK